LLVPVCGVTGVAFVVVVVVFRSVHVASNKRSFSKEKNEVKKNIPRVQDTDVSRTLALDSFLCPLLLPLVLRPLLGSFLCLLSRVRGLLGNDIESNKKRTR
jgi:hypothetical protein